MVDAAVSALVKDVLGRLTSVALEEFGLLWEFKNSILTLKDDFSEIQAVLEDAKGKRVKQKEVDLWLKRVRSASLEVENVLDEVSTESLLQRLHKERGIKYRVRAFFSSNHNQLMFRVRTTHKIKAIRKNLDAIKSKRSELGLTPGAISHVDIGGKSEMPDRETSSLIHASVIFGRNEEMEMVTEKICNKHIGKYDDHGIRVYSIWGMGGMGKTTLAQLVYNHKRVSQYFELRCWVYVSENFQVKEIIKRIIASIDKCECALTHLDVLQESLQNKLRGKKFLIVLDDVWIEEGEKTKWDQLSETLSCGSKESIVLMTTRSHTTSRLMTKVPELQHKLGCLSEEDSWLLFKKLAFTKGRDRENESELEHIGREMVKKCKGLPLAVKTLGSLMWSKRSTNDWNHLKDNNIWELDETEVLPAILKLSYDNLLDHLKRCFAYCCLFPKGYEMKKDVLISLWVSNGFIPPRGGKDLYMLGEEILNCLVWRSFFQEVDYEEHTYKMHDLMHDMAQHVMGDDCLVIEPGKEAIIPVEALHLSSSCPDLLLSSHYLRKLRSLNSIFMFGEEYTVNISQVFNHVCLRVLYLHGVKLRTLPESIRKLKHLRYLNLSESSIEVLPESIIYLQNLQALILYGCEGLCNLTEGLRFMRNLQHLDIEDCSLIQELPLGIKDLTNLRTLPQFPVGQRSCAKIGELVNLNLLEGRLLITGLDFVEGLSEAKSANLKGKTNLSGLRLSWLPIPEVKSNPEIMFPYEEIFKGLFAYEEVLDGLEPSPGLKELTIYGYRGNVISPSWMVNLRNLVEITCMLCDNCEHIPTLGRLPNLKVINFVEMDSLQCFHDDDTNMSGGTTDMFLSLQKLYIIKCPNLVSLPSNLPKLKELLLDECNEVSLPSNLPKLENLQLENFKELVSLPSNLPNITTLELQCCDGFLSLPDEIQSYKNLNQLVIHKCKHLSERCKKETGVDWPKISHIPKITIILQGE